MNRHWGIRLGDVVEIKGGGTPSTSNPDFWTGDIPWVSPKDMKSWVISDAQDKITKEAIEGSATNLVPAGSILVVNRSGVLKHTLPVGITDRPVAINQDIKALICGPMADQRFLAHIIKASEPIILTWVRATTADNFSVESLKNLEIPLPPLDEQRRIAAILDRADALRQKRKRAIALLDSLTQSIFLEMFGDPLTNERSWPTASIGDLLARIDSGWSPVCLAGPAADDEWGVLKLSAVTTGMYLATEQKALPRELNPRPALEVREGDVLFTRKNTRDLVAATALVGPTRTKLMLSDLIFRLVPGPDVLPAFLWAALSYPTLRMSIQSLVGGAAGSMPNISKEKLRSVTLIKPSIVIQRSFVAMVSHHRNLKDRSGQSLNRLEQNFSSLQHRAFSGQL